MIEAVGFGNYVHGPQLKRKVYVGQRHLGWYVLMDAEQARELARSPRPRLPQPAPHEVHLEEK